MPLRNGVGKFSRKSVKSSARLGARKTFRRSKSRLATLAQVRQIVRKNIEKKYWTQQTAFIQTDSSGAIGSLTDVPQNTAAVTDQNRTGDAVSIRSVEFWWSALKEGGTIPAEAASARVIIFQWIPNSTPTVANILLAVGVGSVNACMTPYAHDYRDDFVILYDKVKTVHPHATEGSTAALPAGVVSNGQGVNMTNPEKIMITSGFRSRTIQYIAGGVTGSYKLYVLKISDHASVSGTWIKLMSKFNYGDA